MLPPIKAVAITLFSRCPECGDGDLLAYVNDGQLSTLKCRECQASFSAREVAQKLDDAEVSA